METRATERRHEIIAAASCDPHWLRNRLVLLAGLLTIFAVFLGLLLLGVI